MSWFNVGLSKKEVEQIDKIWKRNYGKKVKTINERKEFDLLPETENEPDHKDTDTDTNLDDIIDYSDNED